MPPRASSTSSTAATFGTHNAAYTAGLLHAGSVIAGITTVGIQAMDSIKGIA